jgi:hypothetical protein
VVLLQTVPVVILLVPVVILLLPSWHQVSHHPMVMACHCEGRGWRFWGESNVKSKFWGQTIQLDPVGVLTLEFDDGEIFKWSKVKVFA